MAPKSKSIAGQKFYKLTAIEFSHRDQKSKQWWIFRCDCGNTVTRKRISVTRGYASIKSCGCAVREANKNPQKNFSNLLPTGTTAAHSIYNTYLLAAKRRNLIFELSKEIFENLILSNCFYCGIGPSNLFKQKGRIKSMYYSGIDRYDNSLGYTVQNSKSCCKICNWAKAKMNGRDFEQYIVRLIEYRYKSKE